MEKSGKNQGKEAFFKESGKMKKIWKKYQGNQGKIGFLLVFLTLELLEINFLFLSKSQKVIL